MNRQLLAIPGQPTTTTAMPAGAAASALRGVERLAAAVDRERWFTAAEPCPVTAHYDIDRRVLMTTIDHPEAWIWVRDRQSVCRTITWRWGILVQRADGAYDDGWHPDATFDGLVPSWQGGLRTAVSGR